MEGGRDGVDCAVLHVFAPFLCLVKALNQGLFVVYVILLCCV
jgi:hypothetical protein